MAKKKQSFEYWTFEGLGDRFKDPCTGHIRKDTSARIFESMMLSEAFQDLSARQKCLYVICKAQFFGHRKPRSDYPDWDRVQGKTCFYLNRELVLRYGLYKKNNTKYFYKDIRALVDHGFIKCVSSGRITRTKSIYEYSVDWKNWKKTKILKTASVKRHQDYRKHSVKRRPPIIKNVTCTGVIRHYIYSNLH